MDMLIVTIVTMSYSDQTHFGRVAQKTTFDPSRCQHSLGLLQAANLLRAVRGRSSPSLAQHRRVQTKTGVAAHFLAPVHQ